MPKTPQPTQKAFNFVPRSLTPEEAKQPISKVFSGVTCPHQPISKKVSAWLSVWIGPPSIRSPPPPQTLDYQPESALVQKTAEKCREELFK